MTQAMDTTLTGDEVIHTHYTLHCSTAKEWGEGEGEGEGEGGHSYSKLELMGYVMRQQTTSLHCVGQQHSWQTTKDAQAARGIGRASACSCCINKLQTTLFYNNPDQLSLQHQPLNLRQLSTDLFKTMPYQPSLQHRPSTSPYPTNCLYR